MSGRPLSFWPYKPEQTLYHYSFHVVYGLAQLPLLVVLSRRGLYNLMYRVGRLDDLTRADRDRYVGNVMPLAGDDARFLLWCFEWRPRLLDRLLGFMPMAPGEVERRFGARFSIERIAGSPARRRRTGGDSSPAAPPTC